MIQNIIDLLVVAKEQRERGEYIDIALGKNKHPNSIKEAYQHFKKFS